MTRKRRNIQAKRRRHGYVMRRPITTHDQMVAEGEAWGDYHAGTAPKPRMATGWPLKRREVVILGAFLIVAELVVGLGLSWGWF